MNIPEEKCKCEHQRSDHAPDKDLPAVCMVRDCECFNFEPQSKEQEAGPYVGKRDEGGFYLEGPGVEDLVKKVRLEKIDGNTRDWIKGANFGYKHGRSSLQPEIEELKMVEVQRDAFIKLHAESEAKWKALKHYLHDQWNASPDNRETDNPMAVIAQMNRLEGR